MDVHLVGGFLGSGKTTSILAAAARLLSRGVPAAVVTNDQGRALVDTAAVRHAGLASAEVTGGCFCCQPQELARALASLARGPEPPVVFAEPVGSCTDLVTTVLRPFAFGTDQPAVIRSLSVFVDIRLMRQKVSGRPLPFGPDVSYIWDSQIEEAGIIVLSKSDLLSPDSGAEVLSRARERYPAKVFHLQSVFDAQGVEQWISLITAGGADRAVGTAVDYERYGAGEVRLAWYDATVFAELRSETGSAVLDRLLRDFQSEVLAAGGGHGHVKILLLHEGAPLRLGVTSAAEAIPKVPAVCGTRIHVTINARVECAHEDLRRSLRGILDRALSLEARDWRIVSEESFHPQPPHPPPPAAAEALPSTPLPPA